MNEEKTISTFEKKIICTNCEWKGKTIIEHIKPQTTFEEATSLISTGLKKENNCPECGSSVIPHTRKMVS